VERRGPTFHPTFLLLRNLLKDLLKYILTRSILDTAFPPRHLFLDRFLPFLDTVTGQFWIVLWFTKLAYNDPVQRFCRITFGRPQEDFPAPNAVTEIIERFD
jgi:hypothetical protein